MVQSFDYRPFWRVRTRDGSPQTVITELVKEILLSYHSLARGKNVRTE